MMTEETTISWDVCQQLYEESRNLEQQKLAAIKQTAEGQDGEQVDD